MNRFQMAADTNFTNEISKLRLKIEQAPARVSLRQVISLFGPRGHWLLALFFVLPFLQPVPIPGLSVPLGACITIIGIFCFLNTPTKIPDRLARIEVEKTFLLRITGLLESLLRKISGVVRPRAVEWIEKPSVQKINAVILIWHAFLLALPLPLPFSNLVPAICIGLIALGCVVEDLAVLVVGYLAAVANAVFFGALVVIPFVLHRTMVQ